MSLIALLDANVLWSAALRDTILRAAEKDIFRPAWTMQILEELAASLKRERSDIDPVRFDRLIERLVEAFPNALVDGYQRLIPAMSNHEGDRHVLAAAVASGADVIVTWNLAHFPSSACAPHEIDVQSPDQFLCHLWWLSPQDMALVIEEQAAALRNPRLSSRQVLETLSRSVPKFSSIALTSGLL